MRASFFGAALLLSTAACGGDTATVAAGGTAPVIPLEDVNPTSPLVGQQVSVATFQGQVSAWYFGHAT